MKKKLYLLTTVLTTSAVLFFSSCLKDKSHYVNFDTGQTLVDFPLGGFVNFSSETNTESTDTVSTEIGVNVASANVPTTATVIKMKVADPADVAKINSLQSNVVYTLLPAADYSGAPTSITIPAGQQYATFTVSINKAALNPSISYVLPITIVSGTGASVAANLATYYIHIIGNDFAGNYEQFFDRWSTPDTSAANAANHGYNHVDEGQTTFYPVDPNTFQVQSAYYTGIPYTVTFVKTGIGASATYSQWGVTFAAADIANYFTGPSGGSVVLASGPKFVPNKIAFDASRQYTFAQSLLLFRFYYTTLTRAVIDEYDK